MVNASYCHRMRHMIGEICEPFSTEELSLPHNADNTVSTGDGSNLFIGEISWRGKDRCHCCMRDDDGTGPGSQNAVERFSRCVREVDDHSVLRHLRKHRASLFA